jgi:uncharacterized protein Veg
MDATVVSPVLSMNDSSSSVGVCNNAEQHSGKIVTVALQMGRREANNHATRFYCGMVYEKLGN